MANSPQAVHRHRQAVVLAGALAFLGAACGARTNASDAAIPTDLVLAPIPETVQVRPGERGIVHFVLRTSQGTGVAGQLINFQIVDDGSSGISQAQGATLSADSAVTDINGSAQIIVNAGQIAVFRIHASAMDVDAEAEAVVVVTTGMLANVQIAPYVAGQTDASAITAIDVTFFDNKRCGALSLAHLPTPARAVRTVATADGVAEFDLISTVLSHAVTGRARDRRGTVQAQGCVDLPGTALVAGDLVRVALPLGDASASPEGQFDVTSQFSFANPPAAAALMAAPWIDLQDCPLDPAQLWLDCTLDALSGDTAGEPNDCQPLEGGEGPIGAAIAARRGALLPAAGGGVSPCRASRDATGAPSHDAMLARLFGAPKPSALVNLHAIADDAGNILNALTLQSHLTVDATPMPNVFTVSHTFVSAQLATSGATTADIALLPLGLPLLEASPIQATAAQQLFTIGEQRITLRLGTVARAAFGRLALVPRGLPADSPGALQTLYSLAQTSMATGAPTAPTATVSGCEALDAVLCADIGQGTGCLRKACGDGLTALAARLDAGFAAANGDGLDLIIDSGAAPIIDTHNAGVADRLGDVLAVPPAPGTWSATLRTHAGNEKLTAQWDARRTGN